MPEYLHRPLATGVAYPLVQVPLVRNHWMTIRWFTDYQEMLETTVWGKKLNYRRTVWEWEWAEWNSCYIAVWNLAHNSDGVSDSTVSPQPESDTTSDRGVWTSVSQAGPATFNLPEHMNMRWWRESFKQILSHSHSNRIEEKSMITVWNVSVSLFYCAPLIELKEKLWI